jgi:hypothetical protein
MAGVTGQNSVSFAGEIQSLPRLPAGNYVLVVVASNGAGQSATQSVRFTIVA